jgi:carbon storage regulator CsrA
MPIQSPCAPRDIVDKNPAYASDNPVKTVSIHYTQRAYRDSAPGLSCDLQNGIPIVRGGNSSYYLFGQDGKRLLILSRKQNQSIIINHSVNIVVLGIKDNEVKLGITCPDETTVGQKNCPDYDDITLESR